MADLATDEGSMEDFDPFAGPAIVRTAPTTEAQREIWTAAHLSNEASLCYNESITVRLIGPVDLGALSASFSQVVDRHEALRSTISDDGLTFLVGEMPVNPVDVRDLAGLPETEREARFADLVDREVESPFDLGTGPLFRMHFVRMDDEHLRAVLTAHHIVFDGWSTAVILKEWAAFYNAHLAGTEAEVDEPLSYCDYAIDEIDYRTSDDHRADVDFWLAQYRSPSLPTLELPSDRPRPRLRTFEARRCDMKLQPEIVQAVRKTGAKQGASLFTTLLAGFEALLFRLSNQDDIVVGIPAAGQSSSDWQTLVGHCVNILPLRSALDGDLPFDQLVGALRSTVLDAYEHQRLTFGSLVAQLPIARDPSRPQLVSVLFNVDRGMPSEALPFEGLAVELETNERHYETFDLFLNAVESPDGVVLECQYNCGLFDEATIRRWLDAYERLLIAVTETPDLPLAELPLVSDLDREQIERWNAATEVEHELEIGIAELIERQVAAFPDAIACEFDGRRLTYAELDARANELALALKASAIGQGDLVGLSVERSDGLLVGLLGILKSGAGYVPLDPGFPIERLEYMVEDAGIAALVTERATQDELQLPVSNIFLLDDGVLVAPSADSSGLPAAEIRPDDVAYVIYTSGSTGKPKGVAVSHRSAINLFHSMQRAPGMSREDVVLAVTTLSFDISVVELLLPLAVGAQVVIASRETASDGGHLLELLRTSGTTYIQATPATFRLLFSAGFDGDPDLKVVCGGEALPMELGQRLVACVGSLWNAYGPTETTIWSSFHQVEANADRVLIGYPADNTRLYVLDDCLEPTPIGVPGELYIAGLGLSLGYLGKPELTAERFVPDPFGTDGSLMYKTGDLARYLSDGQLECLGRNDFQVKVRGYRIELGEIEHVLDLHLSVAQSIVMAREDTPGDTRLAAYVRLNNASETDDAELRSHLKLNLPDYMVPSVFVRLTDMPLTPNGKVDRMALPAPLPAAVSSHGTLVEPRTETESLIAELFQDALSVPRVSVDDDFFALGGHSLLASQVLARLRQDHGISVSFRVIFETPTVEGLAARVEGMLDQPGQDQPVRPAIEHNVETGDAPLSVAQERLWLLEEMDPSQELVHNLPAAWRLEGSVDLELLQRAVDEIARRHGTLRTHLARVANTVVQRIEPSVELPIEAIDLRGVAEADREAELIRVVNERTQERFDLYELPLFRSYLIRVDEERYVFHSVRHNLIWDGWSFDIFLREFTALYSAFQRGEASPLPELPVSYADYVGYQRQFLDGPEVARQIDFWTERLAGELPEATLPTDRPRPRTSQHTGENLVVSLGRAQADALTSLGREHGATLYMVLLAAFKVMLHRYSKERDLVVGTPVRARQLPEVEGLIGPFINAVALRTSVEPDISFTELLARVREVTLDSFSNEDMPLEMLGSRPPVVRTFFSFQDAKNRPPMLGDVPVEQLHAEPPAAANDLMMWMMETPSDLLAVANYSAELYDHGTIEVFLEGFRTLLDAVVSDPDTAVGVLPISAGGPEASLRRGQPEGDLLDDPCASWIDQAARQPDAPAVRSGEQVVSYAQLVASAAGIASLLPSGDREVVGVHASAPQDRAAAMLACLAMDRPFTLLTGDAPAAFVARQRSERGCQFLLAADDSDLPDDPDTVRFGRRSDSSALDPIGGSPHAGACLSSEGRPTSRAAVATTAEALADALGIEAGHQIAWVLPAGSDPELLLTLATLGRGACANILSPRDRLDRSGLEEIDVLVAAPSTLGRYSAAELAGVRTVVVIGEPAPDLTERLMAGGKPLLRLHVTDEVGLVAFLGDIPEPGAGTCIGRPLYPARAAVVDATTGPCSEGIEGELFIATAAQVVTVAQVAVEPAPVSWFDGAASFVATGDRSRVRADGRFEIRGLAPERIHAMGVRFDGTDIATCIESHPAVSNAHVGSSQAPSGDLRLTAYVRGAPGEPYTATELRRHVRDHLPEVMVPQLFVDTDEWPTAADGLLDVDRLYPAEGSDDSPFVQARSESERLLAEVWQDDLGVERVGVHDNFFALGGHSLLCFKVLAKIEDRTGARLGPRVMLLGSLEQAAGELDAALGHAAETDEPPTSTASSAAEQPKAGRRSGRLLRKLRNPGGGS